MEYPDLPKIRAKLSLPLKIAATLAVIAPWILFVVDLKYQKTSFSFKTTLNLLGLTIDIIGVTFTLMSVPHFGAFLDGGELEAKRQAITTQWQRRGMIAILLGFILQAISVTTA